YSLECIENWIKNKNSCPLCKTEIKELVVKDEGDRRIEVLPPQMPHPSKVEADLACLDHTYFTEEINKLLILASSVGYKVENARGLNSSSKVYVNHTANNQGDITLMVTINESLGRLQHDMEQLTSFDPQQMLSELYSLETTLKDLDRVYNQYHLYQNHNGHNNNNSNINSNSSNSNNSSNRHGHGGHGGHNRAAARGGRYDDDDYDDDYYYDDSDDEDHDKYYESVDDNKQRYPKSGNGKR
ncbi:hypothetical protein SAMD00019534_011600, partial [Acytostelium subglobosum LB1]|uniref:hypothetical protein n=1 Tax=Acytostelium subglobosum LB1 TaxID=1410327 RepID=UPI000644B3BB